MGSFGNAQSAIGLDIGSEHVRLAQVKRAGSGFMLGAYAVVDLPMGAVVEGEIVDAGSTAAAIREAMRRSGARGKDVGIGVANQRVIVRLVDLPYMEREELAGAIQYQAQDYIPMAVEDSVIDFQIIGDYMTSADEHMMEVLLVAAHRDMINGAVGAVDAAGLRLASVDVSSFALVRALLGTGSGFADDEGYATAIVHVASSLTNIVVVERGVPRFTRISSLAGSQFTQAIARTLDMEYEQAETLKRRVGLPAVDGSVTPVPADIPGDVVQSVHDCLEREVSKFIAEIRRSLDYYLTQTSQMKSIRRILLTGSGAQLQSFPKYLEKGLQAQVLLADPLGSIGVASSVRQVVEEDRMGCATAIGLALGGLQE